MMKMMEKMMGQQGDGEKEGFNPMDMCRQMMSSMREGQGSESFVPPELANLFNDWLNQINEEVIGFMQTKRAASIDQVAEHLKISANSVIYLLAKLAQQGKVKLTAELMET